MSLGPLGGIGPSAAGAPLSQSSGTDVERVQQESANQKRRIRNDQKADAAAGIAATDGEDTETEDRDADGRRLWEAGEEPSPGTDEQTLHQDPPPKSKDPTGDAGTQLDLTG